MPTETKDCAALECVCTAEDNDSVFAFLIELDEDYTPLPEDIVS